MDNATALVDMFPAHIVRERAGGGDTELLALAKKAAPDPTIFDESEPYFWAAEISNNSLDAYFTRMATSSLKNYAQASDDGVAFMTSHDVKKLPMGRSLRGSFTGASGNGKSRVVSDFYTLRDMNTNGISTEEFIKGVRSGVLSDVSIGFHGGEFICSICNRDMMKFDWTDYENNCWHVPGVEYNTLDKKGKETSTKAICIADVENAGLSEVSAVYDGATPGASIRKATILAEAGKLPPAMARQIEVHYQNRFKLPSKAIWAPGEFKRSGAEEFSMSVPKIQPIAINDEQREVSAVEDVAPILEVIVAPVAEAVVSEDDRAKAHKTVSKVEDVREDEEVAPVAAAISDDSARVVEAVPAAEVPVIAPEKVDADMALTEELRAVFAEAGVPDLPENPVEAVRKMSGELARLRPLADDGRQYRTDLIEETLLEGARAFGVEFPREQRAATLAKLDLPEIKGFRDEWRSSGDKIFKTSRATVESEVGVEEIADAPGAGLRTRDKRDLPAEAYHA